MYIIVHYVHEYEMYAVYFYLLALSDDTLSVAYVRKCEMRNKCE
jgi:hypothetical protein